MGGAPRHGFPRAAGQGDWDGCRISGIGLSLPYRAADSRLVLSRPLAVVPAVLTGILAGDTVLIEVVLLPFWRGMSAADFRDWFTAHSGRMRDLMVPLGAGAGTVGAASAVAHLAD
jgi:hypothetical protein